MKPKDVRGKGSPHSAVLWFAALNPRWMMSMDGTTVPYLWIPGYEVKPKGSKKWSHVPVLSRYAEYRQVYLIADVAGHCHRHYARCLLSRSEVGPRNLNFGSFGFRFLDFGRAVESMLSTARNFLCYYVFMNEGSCT